MRTAVTAERRARLTGQFSELHLDALVVSALPNIRYLTGFTGSHALLLLTPSAATLFTDPRYEIQANRECDCPVRVVKGPLTRAASALLARKGARDIGFESSRLIYDAWAALGRDLGRQRRLRPVSGLVEKLRMVKSPEEIDRIEHSVAVNSKAFEKALGRFKPEMREMELAAELDYQMRRLGAEGPAFETIVASGVRTALPHARPTSEPIRSNTLLLIDMGAQCGGYASDMTRVVAIGNPGKTFRSMYAAVLEAQQAATASVRPGVNAGRVDATARRVLRRHGLDRLFSHSTGHGLGLEIHESPRLGKKEKTALETGMAITIEPGVYLEGSGGIRIEDTVVVTDEGVRVLTPTPKELVTL
jgi:Xaa-Pro aminopeptidase